MVMITKIIFLWVVTPCSLVYITRYCPSNPYSDFIVFIHRE